jgi:hypothetical protein
VDSWKLLAFKTKQDALALDYARDGFALLGALYAPGQPMWLLNCPPCRSCGPCCCRTTPVPLAEAGGR